MRIAQIERSMLPHGFRPTDEGLDTVCLQMLPQLVAVRSADDIVLKGIEVAGSVVVRKRETGNSAERIAIEARDMATMVDPVRKMPQLYIQHCGLHVVEKSGLAVIVVFAGLAVLAVIAQAAGHARDLGIRRGDGAAVAKASERLERIEPETTGQAEGARLLTAIFRTDGLRRILYDG